MPTAVPTLKSFDIRKCKTAASHLLKSGRVNENKKLNKILPACNLPEEVLQRIFIACAQTSFRIPLWSWISFTFVCSLWRQAALDCRELWSYIDFSHPKWTVLSLYRSQLLPISVHALVRADNQHLIHHTLQHAPMINDIHLVSSVHDLGPLMGVLKNPNRYLKSLIVDVTSEDNHDTRHSKRLYPPSEPLPSLKHLELHHAPINLISSHFNNLRSLSLHYIFFSGRVSRRDLFSLLKGFTFLENLILDHAFPENVVGGCEPKYAIHLPNLLRMSLTGPILNITNILENIHLPPTTLIHCHIDSLGTTQTAFQKLAEALKLHFRQRANAVPLDTLVLTSCEEAVRFTDGYTSNPQFRQSIRIRAFGAIDIPDPILDLAIDPGFHRSSDDVIVTALMEIWNGLPLKDINTLTLQNCDVVTQKSWAQLLSPLTSLRVIDIGGNPPSGLIWALLLNAQSHSHLEHDDMDLMLLPALEDMYLRHIDCRTGGLMISPSGLVNSFCDLDDSPFLDVLSAYLEDRQRCCLPLRSLSLSRCSNVLMSVLSNMRSYVSHLLWDHRGMYNESTANLSAKELAVYRNHWVTETPPRRHYYRLRALVEISS